MVLSSFNNFAFVDWDDTIKVTNALYTQVSGQNANYLLAALPKLNWSSERVKEYIHRIDLAKAHYNGLSPANYPDAWVQGYKELATLVAASPVDTVTEHLWNAAAQVNNMEQPDYTGAPELITYLRQHGYEITIWTAGNQQVQMGKIERAGYLDLVDRVYVVPEKTTATLQAALACRQPQKTCVIGNSPRADVLPALAVGAWAVHVCQAIWEYDEAKIDYEHPCYRQVSSLQEVPDMLVELFSAIAS